MPIAEPTVEVVDKDGHHVSNPRMDPSIMNFIMLASVASQAVRIRKYFDDRTSRGLIQTYNIAATDVIQEIKVDYPAQSITIFNDGVDSVFIGVNTTGRPKATLNNGEQLNIDYEVHKIRLLYLQCNPGEVANVRIIAKD